MDRRRRRSLVLRSRQVRQPRGAADAERAQGQGPRRRLRRWHRLRRRVLPGLVLSASELRQVQADEDRCRVPTDDSHPVRTHHVPRRPRVRADERRQSVRAHQHGQRRHRRDGRLWAFGSRSSAGCRSFGTVDWSFVGLSMRGRLAGRNQRATPGFSVNRLAEPSGSRSTSSGSAKTSAGWLRARGRPGRVLGRA